MSDNTSNDVSCLLAAWESWRSEVIPGVTNPAQIDSARKTFYCGALACFSVMFNGVQGLSDTATLQARRNLILGELVTFERCMHENGGKPGHG